MKLSSLIPFGILLTAGGVGCILVHHLQGNRSLNPGDFSRSWDLPTLDFVTRLVPSQWLFCLYVRFKSLPKEQIGRLHDFFFDQGSLKFQEKKILVYQVWICQWMAGDVALSLLAEQTCPGGGRHHWLGAGQPCSTLQVTWLWPALLGAFCHMTVPNLVYFLSYAFPCSHTSQYCWIRAINRVFSLWALKSAAVSSHPTFSVTAFIFNRFVSWGISFHFISPCVCTQTGQ